MANDRTSAYTLVNILEEAQFDHIWIPQNKGDDDSWGALLNENFETIIRTFVNLDERITLVNQGATSARNIADEANNRSIVNGNSLSSLSSSLSSLINAFDIIKNEVWNARGDFNTLDQRLDILLNNDGTPKHDIMFSGALVANYLEKQLTYAEETNALDITDYVSGETFSNGSDYGLIAEAAQTDDEVDNICHMYHPSGIPYLTNDGDRIYGRLVNNYIYSYYLDKENIEQNYIFSSGEIVDTFLPKMFDYDTVPKLNKLHDNIFNIPVATSEQYGIVKLGSGNSLDADTVDNIHAASSASPNKLVPLNSNARFPASIIEVTDNTFGVTTLSNTYSSLLKTRTGESNKSISNYIGAEGNELFAKVAVSGVAGATQSDLGGQFTIPISEIEASISDNETNISNNLAKIDQNISDIDSLLNTIVPDLETAYILADQALKDEILLESSGDLSSHVSNIDAHHPADMSGVAAKPASVDTPIGTINNLTSEYILTEEANIATANIDILNVRQQLTSQAQSVFHEDKFIELNALQLDIGSGVLVTNSGITTSDKVPQTDDYTAGIMLRQDEYVYAGLTLEEVTYKASLLRYNKINDTLEFCKDWKAFQSTDTNEFTDILAGHYNQLVDDSSIQEKLNIQQSGKIAINDGYYAEDLYVSGNCTLEGVGSSTRIAGTIYVEGSGNLVQNLYADNIVISAGAGSNKVLFNWINSGGNITDNSSEVNNVIFGNTEI